MIKFTDTSGVVFLVNPAHVVHVSGSKDEEDATITFSDGGFTTFNVEENTRALSSLIEAISS